MVAREAQRRERERDEGVCRRESRNRAGGEWFSDCSREIKHPAWAWAGLQVYTATKRYRHPLVPSCKHRTASSPEEGECGDRPLNWIKSPFEEFKFRPLSVEQNPLLPTHLLYYFISIYMTSCSEFVCPIPISISNICKRYCTGDAINGQ